MDYESLCNSLNTSISMKHFSKKLDCKTLIGLVLMLVLSVVFTAMLSSPNNALLSVSTDYLQQLGSNQSILVKSFDVNGTVLLNRTINLTINYPNGSLKYNASSSLNANGIATFNYEILSNDALGVYSVIVHANNPSETVNTSFQVVEQVNTYDIFIVNNSLQQPVLSVEAMLNGNASFLASQGIHVSGFVSKSGIYHYANKTINNQAWHFLITDPNIAGVYDTVIIDDDANFARINNSEDLNQGLNYTEIRVGEFQPWISNKEFPINYFIVRLQPDGSRFIAVSPVKKSSFNVNEVVKLAFIVTNSSGALQEDNLSITITSPDSNSTQIQGNTSSSNEYYYLTNFTLSSIGTWTVSVNNATAIHLNVETFKIIVDITTPAGETSYNFAPGSSVVVKALLKTSSGQVITNPDVNPRAIIIAPSGSSTTINMTRDGTVFKATFSNTSQQGSYKVIVNASYNQTMQQATTGFTVNALNLFLEAINPKYIGREVELKGFAPGQRAFVVLVGIDLTNGFPATLNCSNYNVLSIEKSGVKYDLTSLNITISSVAEFVNSSEYQEMMNQTNGQDQGPPPESMGFCMARFNVPLMTGNYLLTASYDYNGLTNTFTTTIPVVKAVGDLTPQDESGQEFFQLSPGDQIFLRLQAHDIVNDLDIQPENITNVTLVSVQELESGLTVTDQVSNFTYNSTTGVVSFITPNLQGIFKVSIDFQALINDSGNLSYQLGNAQGVFELTKYLVYGGPAASSQFGRFFSSNDTVVLEVHVIDPKQAFAGGSGPSGAFVKPLEVWNFMLNKKLSSSDYNATGAVTSNGVANISLIPNNNWDTGFYGVKLLVNDSDGVISYGWAGFEVRNLLLDIFPVIQSGSNFAESRQLPMTNPKQFIVMARDPRAGFENLQTINNVTVTELQYMRSFPPASVSFTNPSYQELQSANITFSDSDQPVQLPPNKAWLINISTLTNNSGTYRLLVRVVTSSQSDVGEAFFSITPYIASVEAVDRDYPLFSSSETMQLTVTGLEFGTMQAHNLSSVTLEHVFSIKRHEEITHLFNNSEFVSSCQANNCSVNLTLANNNIERGEYVLQLTITDEDNQSVTSDYWFMVRDQVIAVPWIDTVSVRRTIDKDSVLYLERNDRCGSRNEHWSMPLTSGVEIPQLYTTNITGIGAYTLPSSAWLETFTIQWNTSSKDFDNPLIPAGYKSSSGHHWLWNDSENVLHLGPFNPGQHDGWIKLLNHSENFTSIEIYDDQGVLKAVYSVSNFTNSLIYLGSLITGHGPFPTHAKGWLNVTFTTNTTNGSVTFLSFLKDNQSIAFIDRITEFEGVTYNESTSYVIFTNTSHAWIDFNKDHAFNEQPLTIGSTFNDTATLPEGAPMQHVTLELDNITLQCENCPHIFRFSAAGQATICYQNHNNNSDIEVIHLPTTVYEAYLDQGLVGWAKTYPGDQVCFEQQCQDIYSELLMSDNLSLQKPSKIFIAANQTHVWANTTASNLAGSVAKTINDVFEDAEQGLWRVKNIYIGQDESFVQVEGVNVLDAGFKVNTSLSVNGKFKLLQVVKESRLGPADPSNGQALGYDINQDSDEQDAYLVLMAATESQGLYDAVIISNASSYADFTDDSLMKVSDSVENRTYGAWHFLSIDASGNEARFYELFAGDWSNFGTFKIGDNVTVPLIAMTPSGSALQGVNITVFKVVRNFNGVVEEQSLNPENNTVTTSTDGIAEYTASFSSPGDYMLGIRSGDNVLEEWKWPFFSVKAFIANTYSGQAFVLQGFSQAQQIVIEPTSIKPFMDVNGSKMQQSFYVTMTTGAIPSQGNNCPGYESPWGDQQFNNSVITSDKHPDTYFLYIYNQSNASNSELYVSIGDCNFSDNNQAFHVGDWLIVNYTGWWGDAVTFNLTFKLATQDFFFLGLNPGPAADMPVRVESFNEKQWFATRVNISGSVKTLLLAKNNSLITNATPSWLMANVLFVSDNGDFSSSTPVMVGETVVNDFKLQNLLTPWDPVILVNSSTSFAMPEIARDDTPLMVAVINESAIGDLNNDLLTQQWWFVLFDDFTDENNALTRIVVDDDYQLFTWESSAEYYGPLQGLNTGQGQLPLHNEVGGVQMPSNSSRDSNLQLFAFNNASQYLISFRPASINASQPLSIVLQVKDFNQQPIVNATVNVLELRLATPFGMVSNLSIVNVSYPLGSSTDLNGYCIVKLTPVSNWQPSDYELVMLVNDTSNDRYQTVRHWFCIGCGGGYP
ncbi:hypothetical protein J7L02_03605 [Candidatus Woesearchaeota archaeon]|nr:hypothetical protein [Candidatus Woesearchaeota archaeon]